MKARKQAVDFSEVEERVIAYVRSKGDLHTKRAAKEFNVEEKDVTKAQRRVGKLLNFQEIYG